MIAHVAGVPLEEVLALAPGAGALLFFARAWLIQHFPRSARRRSALRGANPSQSLLK